MKWFKHDSDAHTDAKLEKVLMRYGSDGYALYWMCLELIAKKVDQNNLTFELEHDAEVLGYRLKVDQIRVQEIMSYMISLGLFEKNDMAIYCYKLAKRVDVSMFPPNHRERVRQELNALLSGGQSLISHGESLISHGESLISQERLDQIRLDQIRENQERVELAPLFFSEYEIQELKKWASDELSEKFNFDFELKKFVDWASANSKEYKNKMSAAKLNLRKQATWSGTDKPEKKTKPLDKSFLIQSEINSQKIYLERLQQNEYAAPELIESVKREIEKLESSLKLTQSDKS